MSFMDASTYFSDPCGASSLPYWKTNSIPVPVDLLILRDDDPRLSAALRRYEDTPYFKLIHPMIHIDRPALPDGYRFIRPSAEAVSDHIASCYDKERLTPVELESYMLHPAYSPDLWVAVICEKTGEIVASGIAELDTDIGEGILEWIQVSREYRRAGWGTHIVCELLSRMQGRAVFATVSGKQNDPSSPRALYESCGFGGGVVWHVLNRSEHS